MQMPVKTTLLVVFLFLTAPLMASPLYTIQQIIPPTDPTNTLALGINDAGMITGSHGAPKQGYVLTLPNSYAAQNFPGSTGTQVFDINNAGNTVGFYVDGGGNTHGFVNQGGTFSTVDAPSTAVTELLGLNNTNRAVGFSGTGAILGQQAISEMGGVFTYLVLPSNVRSQATDINSAGNMVGWYMPDASSTIGFLDVGGAITPVVAPGATFTEAWGVNDSGAIVGNYVDSANVTHGFIDLGGTFTSFDVPGADLTTITDINNSGQIVGWYTNASNDTFGFVATPTSVPEPTSLSLLLIGLASVSFLRKRKLLAVTKWSPQSRQSIPGCQ